MRSIYLRRKHDPAQEHNVGYSTTRINYTCKHTMPASGGMLRQQQRVHYQRKKFEQRALQKALKEDKKTETKKQKTESKPPNRSPKAHKMAATEQINVLNPQTQPTMHVSPVWFSVTEQTTSPSSTAAATTTTIALLRPDPSQQTNVHHMETK